MITVDPAVLQALIASGRSFRVTEAGIEVDAVTTTDPKTLRQERNARYYEAKKSRLTTSETVLIKTVPVLKSTETSKSSESPPPPSPTPPSPAPTHTREPASEAADLTLELQTETRSKGKGTIAELKAHAVKLGLLETDGESCFATWEGNGWKNDGRAIKCWRSTMLAWKFKGYHVSQRNGNTSTPHRKHASTNTPTASTIQGSSNPKGRYG